MTNLWTSSQTIGAPSQLIIEYKITNAQNQVEQKSVTATSTTSGSSTSEYTVLGYTDRDGKPQTSEVLVRKVEKTSTTVAAVNPGYTAWRLSKGIGLAPGGNALSENITTSEYTTTVDGPLLVTETSDQYISLAQFAGGLQIEEWGSFEPSGGELVLSHRTIRRMEYAKTFDGRDVTRTLTERYINAGESAEWKSYAARRAKEIKAFLGQFPEAIEPFVRGLTPLVYEGTEVQIETGRIPVPEKPSDQDIAAGEVGNGRGDIPSDATPGSWYGNNLGWPAYAPGGGADGNWQQYAVDSNNDGVPDWKEFVPDSYEDYDQDSNSDGIPDWADYVPAEEGGPSNWEEFDTDTNNDGVPDWADFVPVGDDFDTKDSDYSTSNPPEINNDKIITGIVLFNGQAFNPDNATVTATYDMPFAPDDYFEYVKGIRKLVRGGATAAAQAFGLTESALDVGHAYGQNIVTGWNEAPTLDLSPVYVQIAGIEGAFLADSSSYAWGPEGMVVSSDLMLLGVSGWYGSSAPTTSWLRLPVAVAGLTQVSAGTAGTPSKANSIVLPADFSARNPAPTLAALPSNGADTFALFRTSQNIVGPTLTLEQLSVATGPLLIAREFEYALVLEPETAAIATGPSIVLVEFTALAPPVAVVSLAGLAPVVVGGASVAVPVAAVSVAPVAPVVAGGASVVVPATAVTVAGVAPDLVGRQRIQVLMPAGAVSVAAVAPVVLTGASVAAPAGGVTVAGVAPSSVGRDKDPNFSSVSLLLHMDGSNGSTTFTDSSSYARSVTRSGNTQISTAQSKFSGASALFDGSSDFLDFADATELEMTGDFTIECFAYPTVTSDKIIAGHGSQNVQLFRINSGATGNLSFFLNGTQVFSNTAAGITANQWQHLAISRSGSTTRMFVDGVQKGSSNTSWTGSFKISRIGGMFGLDFQGHLDEFRITKGISRYNAAFTPPAAPFPDA